MADNRSLEMRVGLTVFMAILIFALGLMWFQGFDIGGDYYEIHAVFPSAGGIDPGDVVNINGLEKGEVKKVSLHERGVLLTMEIDSEVRIPDDSKVVLQAIGLMGERIVSMTIGESESYLDPGAVMEGTYDQGISEVLASLGRTMSDFKRLMEDVSRITDVLMEEERLERVIGNLASVTNELNDLVSNEGPALENGIKSFADAAGRIDGLLERNSSLIDSMVVSLDEASSALPDLLQRIGNVTDALSNVVKRLESDDNTMGVLLQDRELVDSFQKAIKDLDELVTDIKKNPKKYLKLEIF